MAKIFKKAIRIMTDGNIEIIDAPEWYDPDRLAWFAGQIGCEWIENVYPEGLNKPYMMVVDEEALLKDRPVINFLASWLYKTQEHGHPICGNALVMKTDFTDEGPDVVGLEEWEANQLADIFRNQLPIAVTSIRKAMGKRISD